MAGVSEEHGRAGSLSLRLVTRAHQHSPRAPISSLHALVSAMKVTVNHYHAVAMWRWNLKPSQPPRSTSDAHPPQDPQSDSDDDDDDVCGICRVAFDGCCPDCKVPGDGCPPSASSSPSLPPSLPRVSLSARIILTLLSCSPDSLGRVHPRLPHALPHEVARDRLVQAAVPDGPSPVGCVSHPLSYAPRSSMLQLARLTMCPTSQSPPARPLSPRPPRPSTSPRRPSSLRRSPRPLEPGVPTSSSSSTSA